MKGNEKTIIICALIIALSIVAHGGFYSFHTVQGGVVHKQNKFTGLIELCVQNRGCREFGSASD
jgi:hypothetical protein